MRRSMGRNLRPVVAPLACLTAALVPGVLAQGLPKFPLTPGTLELSGTVAPHRFINAVGERAGMWGFETGRLEAWVYPLKILRDFHLAFEMEGWPGIHRGDDIVRGVRVQPHMVQLDYATELFAVTETLFAPRQEPGLLILLEVRAPASVRILARFRPELNLMWPAGVGGQAWDWEAVNKWIRLSEPSGRFSAVIGSPAAVASSAVGYRPYLTDADPYETLELRVSPEEARRSYVPIVIAGGIRDTYDAAATYRRLLENAQQLYEAARRHYIDLEERGTQFVTPLADVNTALRWARVALEQLKVCNPTLGCSYVSGYGSSGTGTRPMYAWFFDEPVIAAWSMLDYGDAEAVKLAFRFIRKYQRADGKVMHEVAQSARYVDWFKDYPFAYIHPDSPLWYLISNWNVYRFTGDLEFLRESWPSIRKAYQACLAILDPNDGLLRIPPGEWGSMETASFAKDAAMAGEWIAALRAFGELSRTMGEAELAGDCAVREKQAAASLERLFWNPETSYYNYGLDTGGKPVTFLNPMIGYSAWFGSLPDERSRAVLRRLSSAAFLSDWGQRNMSFEDPRYEEGSYQVGSVWPFLTAGPMLAQYRYRNAVQGFLTWTGQVQLRYLNARGAMPEALSGGSYRLLDRAVPHQMFSEHAIIPGLVQGILGLEPDVPRRVLKWAPQLPPSWPSVAVRRFPFGDERLDLELTASPGDLKASISRPSGKPIALEFAPALPAGSVVESVVQDGRPIPYKVAEHPADRQIIVLATVAAKAAIHIRYRSGIAIEVVWQPLLEAEESRNLRVVNMAFKDSSLRLDVAGRPDRLYQVRLYTPWRPEPDVPARIAASTAGYHLLEIKAPKPLPHPVDKAGYTRWQVAVSFSLEPARQAQEIR